jgi:hypothetical protein
MPVRTVRATRTSKHDLVFDIVIVGSGPSAMGIILGLLSSVKENEVPPFTIAVVERGDGDPAEQTRSPQRWFAAAHDKREGPNPGRPCRQGSRRYFQYQRESLYSSSSTRLSHLARPLEDRSHVVGSPDPGHSGQ